MSKGSGDRVRDKKRYDENYEKIDWGVIRRGESLDDAAARHFTRESDWWDRARLEAWNEAVKQLDA